MADLPSRQEIEKLRDFNQRPRADTRGMLDIHASELKFADPLKRLSSHDLTVGVLRANNKKSCVSIFLPLEKSNGSNGMSDPNRIKLKNMLNLAYDKLRDNGVKSGKAKKILNSGLEILERRHVFWPNQQGSIAVFIHEDLIKSYLLPEDVDKSLTIGQGFNTKPLESFISNNANYFLLALSHNNVTLYEGDKFKLEEVKLEELPSNMEEALRLDEYPKIIETHSLQSSRTAQKTGSQSEGFHGQYNKSQVDKTMLVDFFRMIDRKLHALLHKKNQPLILAGVDYLIPLYKKVNTYNELHTMHLSGNFENSRLDLLREKAWAAIANQSM